MKGELKMSYSYRPPCPPKPDCRYDRCDKENWRVPLFGCDPYPPAQENCGLSKTVTLTNPCCPSECAEVELSVDCCGNLVICVRRDTWKRKPKRYC